MYLQVIGINIIIFIIILLTALKIANRCVVIVTKNI